MKPIFKILRKVISLTLITAFIGSSLYVPKTLAGEMVMPIIPKPGTMVNLSPVYTPAYLKGIVIHPDNALKFDFLVHKGDGNLDDVQKRQEYNKLIKYFLAALTVPDKDQWVNLSPYEKNRIVENDFGATEMGRDLLSQDYLLKQITSSLMYPESSLGKVFWDKVYERAYKEYGTTDIPVNTFNKVWIVPDDALIYEKSTENNPGIDKQGTGNITAYVVKSHLKVMLEEDYLSLKKHSGISTVIPAKAGIQSQENKAHSVASKVIREVILPEIEKEVNTAKNFAMLRQVFSGMVLATWYKKALKESLLGEVYADKAKVLGVDQNPKNNQAIYQKYLAAFKKGVYNYIKEDTDKYTNQVIPRKYFAGGFIRKAGDVRTVRVTGGAMDAAMADDKASITEDLAAVAVDPAQRSVDIEAAQRDKAVGQHILDEAKKIVREQDWSKLEELARLWGEQAQDHGEFFQITFSRSLLGAKEWLKSKINEIIPGAIIDFEENGTPGNIQTVVKIKYPDAAMVFIRGIRDVGFTKEPWYVSAHEGNMGLYHNLAHSTGAGSAAREVAMALGLPRKVVIFLGQVGDVHDLDPFGIGRKFANGDEIGPREKNTPASVRRTIALLKDDWFNRESLDNKESKRSYLRAVLGWNELMFYMALAIIQRSEFPFWEPNPFYKATTPLKEYKDYLEKVEKMGGDAAWKFTVQWGAYFSEYIDKANGSMRLNFADEVETVNGLAEEINNRDHLGYTGQALNDLKKKFMLGTNEFMNFSVGRDREEFGLDMMDWKEFIKYYLPEHQANYRRNKERFQELVNQVEAGVDYYGVLQQLLNRSGNAAMTALAETQSVAGMTLIEFREEGKIGSTYGFNLKDGRYIIGELRGLNRSDPWSTVNIRRRDNDQLLGIDPLQIKGRIMPETTAKERQGLVSTPSYVRTAWSNGNLPEGEKVVAEFNTNRHNESFANPAMKGGIDLNAANLAMVIKRDGRGVPLPVSQQDMAQLARIQGFVPRILEIKPASSLPFLSDAK